MRAPRGPNKALSGYANATGGAAFVPKDEAELPAIFNRIASELRSQYLLQYYSNNEAANRDLSAHSRQHTSTRRIAGPHARGLLSQSEIIASQLVVSSGPGFRVPTLVGPSACSKRPS